MSGGNYDSVHTAVVALDGTGDVFIFAPGVPVEVMRWGFIVTTLLDVGVGFTIAADKTNSAGTRGDGDLGTITTTADVATEDGLWTENVSPDVTLHPTEPHLLIPGELMTLQVTDAADTTGDGHAFIEYRKLPFVGDSASPVNWLANMTQVTS